MMATAQAIGTFTKETESEDDDDDVDDDFEEEGKGKSVPEKKKSKRRSTQPNPKPPKTSNQAKKTSASQGIVENRKSKPETKRRSTRGKKEIVSGEPERKDYSSEEELFTTIRETPIDVEEDQGKHGACNVWSLAIGNFSWKTEWN